MRILNTLLAVILTAVNMFRYNLPTYYRDISVFDTLSLMALMIACIIGFTSKKNVLTEGLLIFNILGCLDSIADELWFDPTALTDADWKITIGIIVFCTGYMGYRNKVQGKPLL